MDDPLRLTFGIELECIVAYVPADYNDERALRVVNDLPETHEAKLEILLRKRIAHVLTTHGFPATDWLTNPSSQQWVVGEDKSVDPPPADGEWSYVDVELKSPAYNYSRAAIRQLHEVINLLREHFYIITNKTCGLHVHVGNQRKGFPLQTLKNFCMLTTIFEPQFSSLHPPDRVQRNAYVKAMTEAFKGVNSWDTALLIQSCRSHEQLVGRFAGEYLSLPDRCWAYNLCPLVFKPKFNTIEFRQHDATTEASEISKWAELACGLVRSAHDIQFENLIQLIQAATEGLISNVVDLLSELNLGGLAGYYESQSRYQHPRPLWAWVDPTMEETRELRVGGENDEYVNGERVVRKIAREANLETSARVGKDGLDDCHDALTVNVWQHS